MNPPIFDRRLVPARPDLAASHLRGQVEAARFVEGVRYAVGVPSTPLRRDPRPDHGIDTELLRGELFTVYDQDPEGWSWGQGEDGYVGWLPTATLVAAEAATHTVSALRSFVYPGPDMKLPALAALPFGSRLSVRDMVKSFARIFDGYVWADHLAPLDATEPDFVATAERFIGVPYLWGGKSSLGLDCSALVQTALNRAGIAAPRDTDMQETALGRPLDAGAEAARGDLVFWRGHVGIMRDRDTLLHANGATMTVHSEAFEAARKRIAAATGADLTSIRRLA